LADMKMCYYKSAQYKYLSMPKVISKKAPTKKPATKSKAVAKSSAKPAEKLGMIPQDFVSNDNVCYNYCLGKVVASSFSGFLAGIVVTSLIWIVVVNVFFLD